MYTFVCNFNCLYPFIYIFFKFIGRRTIVLINGTWINFNSNNNNNNNKNKNMYIKRSKKWILFSRETNIKASAVSRTLQRYTRKNDYISLNNQTSTHPPLQEEEKTYYIKLSSPSQKKTFRFNQRNFILSKSISK